ncbi:hypothetical protein [Chitinimonas lacunae]|uniref:Uncharacterized protein n=1 Tax=Chitinimonas lacunae TaxID=1963018 RepID=A0ABV8MT11_9NEIS
MKKLGRRHAFIQSLLAVALFGLAQAGTCDPRQGTSEIGFEIAATSERMPDGSYYYESALLRCQGGQIVSWATTTTEGTPEAVTESITVPFNMNRVLRNECGSHIIILHNKYKGTLNGIGPNPQEIPGMLYLSGERANCPTQSVTP